MDSGIRTWWHPVGPADGLFSVRAPVAGAVLVRAMRANRRFSFIRIAACLFTKVRNLRGQ